MVIIVGEYLLGPSGMAMFVLNLRGPDIKVRLEANFVCFANGSRQSVVKCGEQQKRSSSAPRW